MALAALEIKTKLADHLVTTALGLVAKHSTDYFTVRGADRLFYEIVPNEYRGQLLHQAVVLCVNFVLFVLARTSGVIYRVRVSGFALAAVVAAAAAAAAVVVDLIRWCECCGRGASVSGAGAADRARMLGTHPLLRHAMRDVLQRGDQVRFRR